MGGPNAAVRIKKSDAEDPFGGTLRTIERITGTGEYTTTGDLTPEAQAARSAKVASNQAAIALGFASEADRIKKINTIINSFGKVRAKKAPLALQGIGVPATTAAPGGAV